MKDKHKPKFELGERVGYDGNQWYVAGIRLKTGYTMILWEYLLSDGFFGDVKHGGPEYIAFTSWLRDDQIYSYNEWEKQERERLVNELERLDKEIKRLDKERDEIYNKIG